MPRSISSYKKFAQYNLIPEISAQDLCLDLNYPGHDSNSNLYHVYHASLDIGLYASYFSISFL